MFPWIDRGDKERGHGENERKRKKEREGGSRRKNIDLFRIRTPGHADVEHSGCTFSILTFLSYHLFCLERKHSERETQSSELSGLNSISFLVTLKGMDAWHRDQYFH